MPRLEVIANAITARLDAAQAEITSLKSARSALTTAPTSRGQGQASARKTPGPESQATPRRARKTPVTSSAEPARAAEVSVFPAVDETMPTAAAVKPARPRASQKPAEKKTERRKAQPAREPVSVPRPNGPRKRRSGDLVPGQIEGLLRESIGGLSLVALVARTGVSDAKVRDRLRELERVGQVRNTGARRTSLWRLITDEERVAERVAELARASGKSAAAIA